MDAGARDSRLDIAALVRIARTVDGQDAVAEAICAHLVGALGLTGASIGVVRHNGEAHLESIAAVGQLSPFIRDMSTPLGAATDATKTALGGEPIFVGNPHGVSENGEADGVSRWRNAFGSHAYAVIALTTRPGAVGVLTLEWPETQTFAAETRASIQLFADVAALVLAAVASQTTSGELLPTRPLPCEGAEIAAFDASVRGLVLPATLGASWQERPAARIYTATSSPQTQTHSAAMAEALSVPNEALMTVAATVSTGVNVGASEAVVAGRQVIKAAATHGSSPREVLGMLGSSMHAQTQAAWGSAIAARWQPSTGALSVADTGGVALIALDREGRFEVELPEATGARGEFAIAPVRLRLVLPGDRLALLSGGRVGMLANAEWAQQAREALADVSAVRGPETAAKLLALARDDVGTAAVIVIDVAVASAVSGR